MPRLGPGTRLADLNIPYPHVVLDEIFHIPHEGVCPGASPAPETIGELAERSGLKEGKVRAMLLEILKMSEDMEISPKDLKGVLDGETPEGGLYLLDVREPWEWDVVHLEGSLLLGKVDFQELLPKLQTAALVVTICHHGVRSYSAAMYLKDMGVSKVKSLTGGVEEWARTVDPTMARY